MSSSVSPQSARQFAISVVRKLREAGYEALWAGGCVRDQLLGIEPSDYDVATNARPDEIRRCFGYRRTLAIGAAFGVITVRGRRDQGQIEVATFRCDAAYSDGRHPDHVSFSTAQEDALRRDFTMNGLFYDPLEDTVIDYVGGQDDLRRGVVRAIGDPYERIAEDKLRMLRAVRFATTFGFELDRGTLEAVRKEAGQIVIVSAERIAAELRKMLVHANRACAVEMLRDVRLLQVVLPEADLPPQRTHPDADAATWENTLGILRRLSDPPFRVALAALLWAIDVRSADRSCVEQICQRWKLSNHEQSGAVWLLARQPTVRRADRVAWPQLQRILVEESIDELLMLAGAIAEQVDGDRRQIDYCRAKLQLPAEQLNPEPLVTGDDLQQAGYLPGPLFGKILRQVRDAQLDGRITTRDEALKMAASMVSDSETKE